MKMDLTPTKLLDYAAKGDITGIDNCLDVGVPVNVKDATTSSTAVHRAVKGGHVDAARHLLHRGANINAADKKYNTPIHIAVDEGHLFVVRMLIERGCHLDLRNTKSFTPIFTACEAGHTAIAIELIEHGANISKREAVERTLLHVAGRSEIVNMLIDKKLDVNAISQDGSTPLHEAVLYRKMKKVETLLKAGADPTIKNKEGKTPRDLIDMNRQQCFKDSEKLESIKTCLEKAMKKWAAERSVSKETESFNETDSREHKECINQSIKEDSKYDMQYGNVEVELQNLEVSTTGVNNSNNGDSNALNKREENSTKKKIKKMRMDNVSDRILGRIAKVLNKDDINCMKSHLSQETNYRLKEDNKGERLRNFQMLKTIQHRYPGRPVDDFICPKTLEPPRRKTLAVDKTMKRELSMLEDDEMNVDQRVTFARKVTETYYLFGIEVGLDWATMERIECEFKNDGVQEKSYQTLAEWNHRVGKVSIKKAISAMAMLGLPYEETWKEIKIRAKCDRKTPPHT